jgi:hypothetical protein
MTHTKHRYHSIHTCRIYAYMNMTDEQHVICVFFFIPMVEGFLVDLEFKKFLFKLQFYPPMITILPFPFPSQHAGHMSTSIIKTVLACTRGYLSTWNLVSCQNMFGRN